MLVTGEEKGLLGSQFYAENPIFPLKNTVANVNVDMIVQNISAGGNATDMTFTVPKSELSRTLEVIEELISNDVEIPIVIVDTHQIVKSNTTIRFLTQ